MPAIRPSQKGRARKSLTLATLIVIIFSLAWGYGELPNSVRQCTKSANSQALRGEPYSANIGTLRNPFNLSSAAVQNRWLIVLSLLLAVRCAIAVTSTSGMGLDFANYYNTGSRVIQGEATNIYQPHSPIGGQPHKIKTLTTVDYAGFPLSSVLFAPLGFFEPRAGILVFKMFCAACLLAALILLYRHFADVRATSANADGDLVPYVLILLMFEPLWLIFTVGGQATAVTFLLLVVFLNFYVRNALSAAALSLSLAILIKPFLGVFVLVFLFAGEWRFLFWLGGALAAESLVSAGLFGLDLHWEWLRVVREKSGYWIEDWWYNASPLSFATNVGRKAYHYTSVERPRSLTLFFLAYRLALITFCGILVRRFARQVQNIAVRRRAYAFLGIALALSFPGIVWEHYVTFLLMPFFFLIWRRNSLPVYVRVLTFAASLLTARANIMFARDVSVLVGREVPLFRLALLCLYGSGTLIVTLLLWPHFLDRFQSKS